MDEILKNEDCRVTMASMDENTVDAIITDPPYELGFMNKKWDSSGIAFNVEMWKECLRVLKPGGHLLCFGGTRTVHRITCAIEDAGFEIRDCIYWVYSEGFPKNGNLGKKVDAFLGNEREVVGQMDYTSPDFTDEQYLEQGSMMKAEVKSKRVVLNKTKGNSEWEGWGTTLKPAVEVIVMARKPLSEKTVVENILKWKTGAINIDAIRIPLDEDEVLIKKVSYSNSEKYVEENKHKREWKIQKYRKEDFINDTGRWPTNFIHDGSEECVNTFPILSGKSASRFFYVAKPAANERHRGCNPNDKLIHGIEDEGKNRQNFHPTVKPVKLMEYLITMTTVKGGIVFDPFAGSGSTLVAAKLLHRNFIGSELERDHYKVALKRIRTAYVGFDFDVQ